MRISAYVFSFLLAFSSAGVANDMAFTGVGGTWSPMKEGATRIQMVRENVQIHILNDKYRVTADFVFHNHGEATTIQMGFPESGGGDITGERWAKKTAFDGFRTYVDGKEFNAQRILESVEGGYDAYWIKTVWFGSRQTRRVHVEYIASTGGAAWPVSGVTSYRFSGGNWAGKVEKSVLTVTLAPGDYVVEDYPGKVKYAATQRGDSFVYTWKNWEAEDSFEFNYVRTMPGWLAWPDAWLKGSDGEAIHIPGRGDGVVWNVPGGVMRRGQAFVNLREWAEKVGGVDLQMIKDGVRVKRGNKVARYYFNERGPVGTYVYKSDKRKILYVPASRLSKELGAKFEIDQKAHYIAVKK